MRRACLSAVRFPRAHLSRLYFSRRVSSPKFCHSSSGLDSQASSGPSNRPARLVAHSGQQLTLPMFSLVSIFRLGGV